MDELRRIARLYVDLQLEIERKNKDVQIDRERREALKTSMIHIMETPEFATVRNFQLQGTTFKVDPPGTWRSSWYLPKMNLQRDIVSYWESTQHRDPEDCFRYIVSRVEARSADTDWRISVTTPGDN